MAWFRLYVPESVSMSLLLSFNATAEHEVKVFRRVLDTYEQIARFTNAVDGAAVAWFFDHSVSVAVQELVVQSRYRRTRESPWEDTGAQVIHNLPNYEILI